MFQPKVKLEFISRYCNPKDGWKVYVDVDGSEQGKTGGERKTTESINRQISMKQDACQSIKKLESMKVQVNGSFNKWLERLGCSDLPKVYGRRDIVALHIKNKKIIIAEAEGDSSGQPETKLYKAMGQVIMAHSQSKLNGWKTDYVVIVCGSKMGDYLSKATSLRKIGITGVLISKTKDKDKWFFN